MNLKNKNVLVIGLAKTGISTLKFLNKNNANIIVNDIKNEDELKEVLDEIRDLNNIKIVLGEHILDVSNIDLAIVSPGVPLDLPFIQNIKNNNIDIIGEVELGYRMFSNKSPKLVGITGTNGKTTTTSLTGELFKNASKDTHIVGNIGNPVIDIVENVSEESFIIAELSSFQLESINTFKPNISVILNLTPDHLNRHHTMENYIDAKSRIFLNQSKNDVTILNYDDSITRELSKSSNASLYYFSAYEDLSLLNLKGAYVDCDGYINLFIDEKVKLMHKSELSLPGVHNLQNSLATALIGYISNISLDIIKETLSTFAGVEHRQEFVTEINGTRYVNDSKATNPDSTIKALSSYNTPVILIAGGMDKKNDFSEMMDEVLKNTKVLIVMGETASDIQRCARLKGFEKIIIKVHRMEDAVRNAYRLSNPGDTVLLSPACASWDMYKNFEERGNEFKECVLNIKQKNI